MLSPYLFAFVLFALALGCAAGLYLALALLPQQIPLDPDEGWNAYHALAFATGGALYPGPPQMMVNNYPPLSFALIGCGNFDFVFVGRFFSLVALAAASASIFQIARTTGTGAREALFGALLFVATLLLTSDYVGMNDPQLLGHAIELVALYELLRRPQSLGRVVFVAFLFVVALFIKHNLFVLPLAVAIWLFLHDRRAALRFAVSGLVFGVTGLILFRLIEGSDLLSHLNTPRTYSFDAAVSAVLSWLSVAIVPIAGLVLLVARDRKNSFVQLIALWAGIGIAVGAAFSGGAGVDVNAFFDADIALALGAALLLARARGYEGFAAAALAAPLAIALYLAWTPDWLTSDFWQQPGGEDAATAKTDIAFLKARPGPALCDTLALCYWAGKKAEVDVFNMGEAFKTGARSDDVLVAFLNEKHYASVQFETLSPFPLTGRVHAALMANYRVDHLDDDGAFLVPR